jgi:phosphoglycerate dehydrogenase-like enzyme
MTWSPYSARASLARQLAVALLVLTPISAVAAGLQGAARAAAAPAAAVPDPSAERFDIAAFIREYGLREAAQPLAATPRWRKPRRVLVDGGADGLATALRDSVPSDVELVVVRTSTEALAAVAVPGTDAAVGRRPFVCNAAMLAAGRDLRWLQTVSAGVEECVTLPRVASGEIVLTNMRAMASPVIAEHALALLFALSRSLHVSLANQSRAVWDGSHPPASLPQVLRGKTMLVVGLGGIGGEIAKRADALGMRVIATRVTEQPRPKYVQYVGKPEELTTLIGRADVVVSAAPLTTQTRGQFDAAMFARMKPTAYFINVSRGQLVVTADLAEALRSGRIAGAGLDVVDPEPLPADSPLWRAPNLVLTPHVAPDSDVGSAPQVQLVRENLRRYVAGERMLSVVDPRRAY